MAQELMPLETIHASAVVLDGTGILILGPSGAGKSALALDLIDQGLLRGIAASLVGDDRLAVSVINGRAFAAPAPNLAGLIEVRGSGIHMIGHVEKAGLDLAVRLVPEKQAVRMPETNPVEILPGVLLPQLTLPQGQAAIRAILAYLGHYGGVKSSRK